MSETLHAGEQRAYGASDCAGIELMPQELEVVSGGFFGRLIRRAGRAVKAVSQIAYDDGSALNS